MKALVIYHANCNDGFGAAWVAYNALSRREYENTVPVYKDGIELFPAMYGQEPPWDKIDKDTHVWIVDFSYPAEKLIVVAERAYYTVVLDHHKTAEQEFDKIGGGDRTALGLEIYYHVNKSGAMLTWDYFNNAHPDQSAPLLIQHIQDRDLWKFELEGTREVHMYLSTLPQTINDWDLFSAVLESRPSKVYAIGTAIKRYYDQTIQHIIGASKQSITIDGIKGLVCNANHMFASDIGNILAKESGTFGATWYQNGSGDACFSIRSIGDFDVSAIAKKFGGGGHKNAAGFKVAFYDLHVDQNGQMKLYGEHE
jgi:nanoRNase/pAp phosphatase (c-di-AMP/oligoRNAs hydrolase)